LNAVQATKTLKPTKFNQLDIWHNNKW
jgi:hypothetical protein